MIEAQTLSEAALTEIKDAPDVDALERIRRDFVGDEDARIPVLLASAHPDHHHHIHDAIARVEAAFKDRLAALEKRRP